MIANGLLDTTLQEGFMEEEVEGCVEHAIARLKLVRVSQDPQSLLGLLSLEALQ